MSNIFTFIAVISVILLAGMSIIFSQSNDSVVIIVSILLIIIFKSKLLKYIELIDLLKKVFYHCFTSHKQKTLQFF
jgi:hypothetical protein